MENKYDFNNIILIVILIRLNHEKLYSNQMVAEMFGITPSRVSQVAKEKNLGTKIGKVKKRYTNEDIKCIEARNKTVGRPSQKQD